MFDNPIKIQLKFDISKKKPQNLILKDVKQMTRKVDEVEIWDKCQSTLRD